MTCPACGAQTAASARFCDQCGTRLVPTDEPLAVGDRRLVTAVFADLVDYSRLVADLDPEDVRARVDAAFSVLAAAVDRYGGTIEKFIGDAVFAVFGAPLARDDDAVRAALCAMAMRASLAEPPAEGVPGDERLHLRIGMATGEVVAAPRDLGGQRGLAYTGQAITTAARLQQLASPDEIVVDAATLEAARGRLVAEPLTQAAASPSTSSSLRGDRGELDVASLNRLLGVRSDGIEAAGDDDFVGRGPERKRLEAELAEVRRSGRGRVILVVGEAGMGKTRLVSELEQTARAQGFAWTWTENASYRSGEPYSHTRLLAERIAIEQGLDAGAFARRLLFGAGTDAQTIARMSGAIAAIARDAAFSGWEEELKLTPTDPDVVATDLAEVADRYTRRLGQQYGPRVVVIDDLHWQDPSSHPMTERMVGATADLPFVVLVTTRGGQMPGWVDLEHVSTIRLDGLDPAETHQLATTVAGLDVGAADARRLYERTNGNPLFIRETVRALMTDRAATRGGRLRVESGAAGSLPVTLRAVLGSRIDALVPEARAVLQVAAVCGIEFEEGLVGRLLDGTTRREAPGGNGRSEGRSAAYQALAGAGLITPAGKKGTWRFAHPLIHDAAYVSLLGPRRRRLHAQLADVLEEGAATLAVGRLARHRAAARDVERGIPLLEAAAEESVRLGAREEAARFLELAADLTPEPSARARYLERAGVLRSERPRRRRRRGKRGANAGVPTGAPRA